MTLAHRLRLVARRAGLDLLRWPQQSNDYAIFRAFLSSRPDAIVDVGANEGQFARECRRFGYGGDLLSFEPGQQAFRKLAESSRGDQRWEVQPLAVGNDSRDVVVNITANEGASSSLLPMLPSHLDAAPDSYVTRRETARMVRLDSILAGRAWQRMALKVDVQGAELMVLEGAVEVMDRIAAIRLECSLIHLYEGDWLWDEALAWMQAHSFTLAGLAPGFTDARSGRLLQFDAVFINVRLDGRDEGNQRR